MHLWCGFDVSRPLFNQAQLDGLQSVINERLPQWSNKLCAAEDDDSRDGVVVGRDGRLFDAIHQAAPPKRGLGSAVLTGSYDSVSFFMYHCDETLPPELNRMSIEVYGPSTVEEQATSTWARGVFEALAARLPIRYGNTHLSEEFDAKNMIRDETGVEAIGVDITDAIPGLYWLNYFGAPYVDMIGRQRLLTAPAYEVKAVGDGVLVALDASADAWQSADYQQREQAVIAHLGKQYFFSRTDPDRQLVAPDFQAHRDPPSSI